MWGPYYVVTIFAKTAGRWHIGRGFDCVCKSVPLSNLLGSCFAYSGCPRVFTVSLKSAGAKYVVKVFVSRTSGVGSIGVIASHIDQSGFDEKQGIKYTTIFAGSRKNDLNPHEPMTSESLGSLQKEVDRLYEMFVQLIARNRGLSIEKIRSTEAGLYFGEKAVEIGLADGVTTFFEFINNHKSRSVSMTTIEENCRREILEIIRLCNVSKMPEKIGEFIEQSVSVEQAREVLMELLAERTAKAEIFSALPQNSSEDLMIQVAKARAQSSI
ncbi:S49 family peptidase [Wolbachia endosymbiont (group B) of Schoenobius gigantella]|uniref:S49 family peptidase n=1 Tax=Wolbachia endosymbiont (group B) of Schoenobius gigantella TaxID=3139313 RepID=UPI003CCABA93